MMKKLIFAFSMMMLVLGANAFAQAPVCNNQNGLEGRIDAIENQGYIEVSRTFTPINYLVQPEPPYSLGTLEVAFTPDCDPGQVCIQIARIYREEAIVVNRNGNCVWRKEN